MLGKFDDSGWGGWESFGEGEEEVEDEEDCEEDERYKEELRSCGGWV